MKPAIGQPVQFIDHNGDTLAATVINVISDDGAAHIGHVVCTLRVTDHKGSDYTVAGVDQQDNDHVRNRWRALPPPAVDFPVAQFVDAVRPLIEEVTRMHVEEELANRKDPT